MIAVGRPEQVLAHAVETGAVPGVVALAADARGVRFQGAFGRREVGQPAPMTLDTVFAIASMTKPLTAVAAMQLVEQGRVTLDEPLGPYLPDLAAAQVLTGFDPTGAPRFRPPRRPISLRHLLTHTAGFAYPIWNGDMSRLQRHFGGAIPAEPPILVFDPGDRWEYGTNLGWAGQLVERLSRLSLEDYFRARILDPLGMADTSYLVGDPQVTRLAGQHSRQANGSLQPTPSAPRRPATFNGGGGLYSTGPDYLRFLCMLLHDGQLDGARILRPQTVAEMARNQIGSLPAGVMTSASPQMSNDANFMSGVEQRWGLAGLRNQGDLLGRRRAGSWAWGGISNTYFWIDPTSRIAGVLLTQLLPFADHAVLDLLAHFEHAIYSAVPPTPAAGAPAGPPPAP